MARNMKFLSLRLKNFLRFGDKPTEIQLDKNGLIIVVGKNGQGKSTIFDGISFALTGKPVRPMPPGKLVNNINKKDMWASIDLQIDDSIVRITRGQKPGFLKFWMKPASDPRPIESQEFSRVKNIDETQVDIERLIRFNNQLFCCMVVNSTRRPSFFQASSSDQKDITENLFGFTSMTDRATDIKASRQKEESSLVTEKALFDERKTTRIRLTEQLKAIEADAAKWEAQKTSDVAKLEKSTTPLLSIDFAAELELAKAKEKNIADILAVKSKIFDNDRRRSAEIERHSRAKAVEIIKIADAKKLDKITEEDFTVAEEVMSLIEATKAKLTEARNEKRVIDQKLMAAKAERDKAEASKKSIHDSCPTCKQKWPDAAEREAAKKRFEDAAMEAQKTVDSISLQSAGIDASIADQSSVLSEAEAIEIKFGNRAEIAVFKEKKAAAKEKLALAEAALKSLEEEHAAAIANIVDPEQLKETVGSSFGSVSDIAKLQRDLENSLANLEKIKSSSNPHIETLERLTSSVPPQEDGSRISELESKIRHRTFLERLLVRKDSPIRTAVLDRYLPYLNERISYYLHLLELDYLISFGGDLDVSVFDSGNEIDPSAISGGEAERLSMAIAWSFRDVFEEITGMSISFSAIDERLDSGLDTAGASAALNILVDMSARRGGSLWLITHKNEFLDHADEVITVERTSKFSGYTTS